MSNADIRSVRALDLFKDMQEENFERLMAGASSLQLPARMVLLVEGQALDHVHVLLEGALDLCVEFDGLETTIDMIAPVRTFLLGAALCEKPALTGARTLVASRVLLLPAADARTAFAADPAFARAVTKEMCVAVRDAVKEIKNLKLRTSVERLANWILRLDAMNDSSGCFRLPCDKGTLASRIGTTRVNLSRNIAQLAEHGVAIRGREVVIKDRAKLLALARPLPGIDDPNY